MWGTRGLPRELRFFPPSPPLVMVCVVSCSVFRFFFFSRCFLLFRLFFLKCVFFPPPEYQDSSIFFLSVFPRHDVFIQSVTNCPLTRRGPYLRAQKSFFNVRLIPRHGPFSFLPFLVLETPQSPPLVPFFLIDVASDRRLPNPEYMS